MRSASLSLLALLVVAPPLAASPAHRHTAPARVTILYDAFGTAPGLTQDWGFAALIEYDGDVQVGVRIIPACGLYLHGDSCRLNDGFRIVCTFQTSPVSLCDAVRQIKIIMGH